MNNALLNMKFVRMIECPHCKAWCEWETEPVTCWACSAEIVLQPDSMVGLTVKNTGATYTEYTAFAKCPNCRRLLSVGTTKCPDCCEELSEEYAFIAPLIELVKTMACDYARTITSSNTATLVIVLAITVGILAFSLGSNEVGLFYLVPFLSVAPLVSTVLWFYRFGRLVDDDKEYLEAKHNVRRMLKQWLLIFTGQVFVVFLLIFPH